MKTISNDNFEEIKGDDKFADYLFADLDISAWDLPTRFLIENCTFRNCKIGAEVNFMSGTLKNVTFQDCNFNGTTFNNCVFMKSNFLTSTIKDSFFMYCIFEESELKNCLIDGNNFSYTMWTGSKVVGGNFIKNNIENLKYRVTGDFFNSVKYENNYGDIKRI